MTDQVLSKLHSVVRGIFKHHGLADPHTAVVADLIAALALYTAPTASLRDAEDAAIANAWRDMVARDYSKCYASLFIAHMKEKIDSQRLGREKEAT